MIGLKSWIAVPLRELGGVVRRPPPRDQVPTWQLPQPHSFILLTVQLLARRSPALPDSLQRPAKCSGPCPLSWERQHRKVAGNRRGPLEEGPLFPKACRPEGEGSSCVKSGRRISV